LAIIQNVDGQVVGVVLQSASISHTVSVDLVIYPWNSELLVDGGIVVVGMGVGDYSLLSQFGLFSDEPVKLLKAYVGLDTLPVDVRAPSQPSVQG